jgi:glycosidase
MWAEIVDGFRCDVAPLVPLDFWKRARSEVEKVRPGCIWLSESIDPGFILTMRDLGLIAQSDGEMYEAFDILYDYDIYSNLTEYVSGTGTLLSYSNAINRQEYIYPDNVILS